MRVVIVDDEDIAREVIENYLKRIPGLDLIASIDNPLLLHNILAREPVDLLFLDIQLPQIRGDKMLKTLKNPPLTIFTTAYSDFAVDAFEMEIFDYLLKPIGFERFMRTINRAKSALEQPLQVETPSLTPQDYLSIRADGILYRVEFKDIIYIQSDREYVKLYTTTRRLMYVESLKKLEDQLPAHQFVRVHHSYIVANKYVDFLDGNALDVKGTKIPISRAKRAEVIKRIFG